MSHSSYQFNNYNPCPSNKKIVTINGSSTTIAGVGDIQISPTLNLTKVLHVPNLSTNLVSIQNLTQHLGFNVIFLPYSLCILRPVIMEDD